MNISAVLELDAGIGPIEVQGTVSNASNQTCGTTKKNNDWQRQWFVLHQGDDKIAVTLWSCPIVKDGQVVKVGGKTELNDKNEICLSANKLGQKREDKGQSKQSSQQSSEPNEKVDWDAKELREHRGHGLHNATLLVVALAEIAKKTEGQSPELIKNIADEFVQYVYEGLGVTDKQSHSDSPTQPSGSNPDWVGDDPPKPPDDDIPF